MTPKYKKAKRNSLFDGWRFYEQQKNSSLVTVLSSTAKYSHRSNTLDNVMAKDSDKQLLSQRPLSKVIDVARTFYHERVAIIWANLRDEQQRELMPLAGDNAEELSEIEQEVNHYLGISTVSLGFAIVGSLFFPLLIPLSILGIAYGSIPIWQDAYEQLRNEQKFGIAGLASIAALTLLLSGYYFAASLGYTLYYISEKLLIRTQDRSKKSGSSFFAVCE